MANANADIFNAPVQLRNLRLLEELDKTPLVSQRELSNKFGIALGATNACLKEMVRKGWVRRRTSNPGKIAYHLTRSGVAEKARLSFELLRHRVHHYAELKRIIGQLFLEMERRGLKRIVFYGVSDEMEVAYITLQGTNLKLVGIVEDDEKFKPQIVLGYEVERLTRILELKPDWILITTLSESEIKRAKLAKVYGLYSSTMMDVARIDPSKQLRLTE